MIITIKGGEKMDKLILENILITNISDSRERIIKLGAWLREETNEEQIESYKLEIGERYEMIKNSNIILNELTKTHYK